jgi:hypothetical protein
MYIRIQLVLPFWSCAYLVGEVCSEGGKGLRLYVAAMSETGIHWGKKDKIFKTLDVVVLSDRTRRGGRRGRRRRGRGRIQGYRFFVMAR